MVLLIKIFKHFHILKIDCSGILGRDFMEKFKCIDYDVGSFKFYAFNSKIELELYPTPEEINVVPRVEKSICLYVECENNVITVFHKK